MEAALLDLLQCPRCAGALTPGGKGVAAACRACQVDFPDLGGVPCLVPEPARMIGDWKREAQRLIELLESQVDVLDKELSRTDLLASSRRRIERLRDANRGNGERIAGLFRDAGVAPDARAKASGREFTMLVYYEQILRDWGGWGRPDGKDENEAAFELVTAAIGHERDLGRMLVLGSGPARLAYDLHQRLGANLTVALDFDPLLILAANRVLFGGGLTLTEFTSDPVNLDAVAVDHELRAPTRPERFFLIAADAFAAPLRPGSFDTVVTPWFIDIVPVDVRETAALVHGLLAPGGRWINYGPLSYPQEHKHGQRYTPDELAAIIPAAGFELPAPPARHELEYLRSRSNGRWKMAEVFTFAARKREVGGALGPQDPPAWLFFRHIPVPRWPGLAGYKPDHPMLGYLVGLIDGQRTITDLAARVVADHGAKPEAAVDGTRAMLGLVWKACGTRPG